MRPAWPEDPVLPHLVLDLEERLLRALKCHPARLRPSFPPHPHPEGPVELPCRLAHCSDCLCPLRCQTLRLAAELLLGSCALRVRHTAARVAIAPICCGPIDRTRLGLPWKTQVFFTAGNCRKLPGIRGSCGLRCVECRKCEFCKPRNGLLLRFSDWLPAEWVQEVAGSNPVAPTSQGPSG